VSPPNGTVKWQYDGVYTTGGDAGFMLNTDFEMFYELSLVKILLSFFLCY
jgi:hypothetical protein